MTTATAAKKSSSLPTTSCNHHAIQKPTCAGEAFVESFANVTRSMLAQSKALARTVSLAQVLDTSFDKENVPGDDMNAANHKYQEQPSGSAYREAVLNDLRSLDTIVVDLERRAAELRAAITLERAGIAEVKEMRESARQRNGDLAAVCERLPQHLPHAAAPLLLPSSSRSSTVNSMAEHTNGATSTNSRSHHRSGSGDVSPDPTADGAAGATDDRHAEDDQVTMKNDGGNRDGGGGGGACRVAPSAVSEVPTVELVTVSELEGVARSTRGRLTLAVVNDAVSEIQKAIEKRHAFLAKPRGKLSEKLRRRLDEIQQQQSPDHEGQPFLSEPDLRALPAFKKGEVTAKALIATLRSLKRLKGVRSSGVMTYAVQGTYY